MPKIVICLFCLIFLACQKKKGEAQGSPSEPAPICFTQDDPNGVLLVCNGIPKLIKNGVAGKDGANGLSGSSGQRGEKGEKGDKGDGSGDPGPKGDKGDPGSPGAPGGPGPKGSDGAPGSPGKNGVAGKDGKPGTNGTNGKDGKAGADGLPGKDGKDGNAQQGPKGDPGKDGTNGRDGAPGTDGTNGKDGLPGKDGEKGQRGEKGDRGDPGEGSDALTQALVCAGTFQGVPQYAVNYTVLTYSNSIRFASGSMTNLSNQEIRINTSLFLKGDLNFDYAPVDLGDFIIRLELVSGAYVRHEPSGRSQNIPCNKSP